MGESKLSRGNVRKLKPGQTASEHGVVYERLDGDGRWWVNIQVDRVRHHIVVGLESQGFTKTQAEDLIATLRAKKHERRHGIASTRKETLNYTDAFKLYLSHLADTGGKDIAKKTERIELHLKPALGKMIVASTTSTDLKKYSAKRAAAGAKGSTINREMAVLSHFFRLAADGDALGILRAPPCRVPRMKESEGKTAYLQPVQAKALLDAAAADANVHVLTFAMIGLHTGMRYSPILRIRRSDIDMQRRAIWVNRDKAGEREQPITQQLVEYLEGVLTVRSDEDEDVDADAWLFPSARSKTGHAVNVYKAFRRVVKKAKLDRVISPHAMRHTMATNAAHAGIDGATLQALGGWKTRRMVERYTHAGGLRDAMDKLQAAYKAGEAK